MWKNLNKKYVLLLIVIFFIRDNEAQHLPMRSAKPRLKKHSRSLDDNTYQVKAHKIASADLTLISFQPSHTKNPITVTHFEVYNDNAHS